MSLPFFYAPDLTENSITPELGEETIRHIAQVLRMKVGDHLKLTNGKGLAASGSIVAVSKKSCTVEVNSIEKSPPPDDTVIIAISPLKNPSRFEWFMEKAAESGVQKIIPLLCKRTEKQHIKKERWTSILVSAMLQSQQSWLTEFGEAEAFNDFIHTGTENQKFIAHCMEAEKALLQDLVRPGQGSSIVLIGPEGDFTPEEIELAVAAGFTPVSLGNTRFRTETAGIAAAILMTHPISAPGHQK